MITIQSDDNDNQIGLDRLTLANEYVILLVSFFLVPWTQRCNGEQLVSEPQTRRIQSPQNPE